MINSVQILDDWQNVMGHPEGSTLGLLAAMYAIGSIASLPVVPFLSDKFGRKTPIIVGCIIMVIAAAVQVCPLRCGADVYLCASFANFSLCN